jgi:alcohol dehydrogenase
MLMNRRDVVELGPGVTKHSARLGNRASHDGDARAVRPNDTVLVLGASGGVGTACVLLAKQVGATVIACASSGAKLERLAALGATHGINYVDEDMREAVWNFAGKPRISGSGGVDLVVNCTGGSTWLDSTR